MIRHFQIGMVRLVRVVEEGEGKDGECLARWESNTLFIAFIRSFILRLRLSNQYESKWSWTWENFQAPAPGDHRAWPYHGNPLYQQLTSAWQLSFTQGSYKWKSKWQWQDFNYLQTWWWPIRGRPITADKCFTPWQQWQDSCCRWWHLRSPAWLAGTLARCVEPILQARSNMT